MTKVKSVFTQVIQDSQDFGGDDEHTVSRVFVNVELGDKVLNGLYADIKQTVRTDNETSPLEVIIPRPSEGCSLTALSASM